MTGPDLAGADLAGADLAGPGHGTTAQGANVETLDRCAQRFGVAGRRLQALAGSVERACRLAGHTGPDAVAMRTQVSRMIVELNAASTGLMQAAEHLRDQADQQRRCSQHAESPAGTTGPARPRFWATPPWDTSVGTRPTFGDNIATERARAQHRLAEIDGELADLRHQRSTVASAVWDEVTDRVPLVDSRRERLEADIAALVNERRRLRTLLRPDRTYLKLDASGDGRLVEVHGDLDRATKVAIYVPGFATTIDDYLDRPKAKRLVDGLRNADPDVAVIDFLDYDPPDWDITEAPLVAGEDRATAGARRLAALVADLRSRGMSADDITVIGHSYGSTLVGISLSQFQLDVGQVAVLGSPGLGAAIEHRFDLNRPEVEIWAGAATGDVIRYAPAHGADPASSAFGARPIETDGSTGHSQYLQGQSLRSLIAIVTGS